MLTGNDPSVGVKIIDRHEVLASTSNTLNLTKTPQGAITTLYKVNSDGTNGTEYTLGTPATNATEFSISGKVITLNSAVNNGTQFRPYYKVNTDATATTIRISSDKFGKSFKVVLDVLVRDSETKKDFAGQIIVPNAKFEDNFDFNFAADGDPSVLTLNMEILKDSLSTDMWSMVVYDDALII